MFLYSIPIIFSLLAIQKRSCHPVYDLSAVSSAFGAFAFLEPSGDKVYHVITQRGGSVDKTELQHGRSVAGKTLWLCAEVVRESGSCSSLCTVPCSAAETERAAVFLSCLKFWCQSWNALFPAGCSLSGRVEPGAITHSARASPLTPDPRACSHGAVASAAVVLCRAVTC